MPTKPDQAPLSQVRMRLANRIVDARGMQVEVEPMLKDLIKYVYTFNPCQSCKYMYPSRRPLRAPSCDLRLARAPQGLLIRAVPLHFFSTSACALEVTAVE